MRTITYTILPGIGPRSIKRVGTLKDLLFAIPYLLSPKLLPPLQVLNDLLRTGVLDAGMSGGCRWPPFEISAQEYDELLAECTTTTTEPLQQVASPEWVQTYRAWSAWVLEYGYGVPAREYLALLIELEQAQQRLDAARKVGDSEAEQVQLEAVLNAGHRWSTFLTAYLDKKS